MDRRQGIVLMILLQGVLGACRSLPRKDIDPYGLQLVTVDVRPEDLGRLNAQVQSKRPVPATIRIAGALRSECQVSYAGRSSLDAYRKSLELELCDARYRQRDSYRLSAQSVDPSMVRSLLGYRLFRAMGMPTPDVEPAAAYLNRNYLGLYLLLETIDAAFFEKRMIEIGEIYKARFGNAGFQREFLSRLPEAFSVEGKPDDFTLLQELYQALWSLEDDKAFLDRAEQLLDVDSFLSYAAVAVFTCHWDGLNNNYYLVFEEQKRKMFVTPWDLDRIWERTEVYSPENLLSINALLVRLLGQADIRARWLEKIDTLFERFPLADLMVEVDRLGVLTAEAYAEDPILRRRPQSEILGELKDRIAVWYEKMQRYRQDAALP